MGGASPDIARPIDEGRQPDEHDEKVSDSGIGLSSGMLAFAAGRKKAEAMPPFGPLTILPPTRRAAGEPLRAGTKFGR